MGMYVEVSIYLFLASESINEYLITARFVCVWAAGPCLYQNHNNHNCFKRIFLYKQLVISGNRDVKNLQCIQVLVCKKISWIIPRNLSQQSLIICTMKHYTCAKRVCDLGELKGLAKRFGKKSSDLASTSQGS